MAFLRCGSVGFRKLEILRCDSVRCSKIVDATLRFGAGFRNQKSYGAVRFGFDEGKNPTVRFGAVHRTDRKNCTVKTPDKCP